MRATAGHILPITDITGRGLRAIALALLGESGSAIRPVEPHINITVHHTLSTVPHEPQDTGICPFSAPRSRCWSGKRSTPWLPSARSIYPRAASRHGQATSILRTVTPRTTPLGAMVSIAPSPMHARRVPADRRLSANASRLSHAHARPRITRLRGEPQSALALSGPAAPPWQRASGPARPLRRACRRSGRRR